MTDHRSLTRGGARAHGDQLAVIRANLVVVIHSFAVLGDFVRQLPRSQCSAFSILPPFSVQACSTELTDFLISSSGVAGRTIKIKSYKRSS